MTFGPRLSEADSKTSTTYGSTILIHRHCECPKRSAKFSNNCLGWTQVHAYHSTNHIAVPIS